eukprot:Clim_evm6s225 gene=Clim_evmTU6s225
MVAGATNCPVATTDTERIDALEVSIDQLFLAIFGMIVFLMQAGFAFLEAGSIRSKNATNILFKNFMDVAIGATSYWLLGYGFAYGGGNEFAGNNFFALHDLNNCENRGLFADFWFQFAFAATAATIVSGAVAERMTIQGYAMYSIILTGFVYPIATHWHWGGGWLDTEGPNDGAIGFQDYAGSTMVHCVGGMAGLVGSYIIGPRIGRFDEAGRPLPMPGHSTVLAALGGFILWFGFLAFNGGSELTVVGGSSYTLNAAIVNTLLAGAGGANAALIFLWIQNKQWSFLGAVNGALGGMVAICAGVDSVYPWAAYVIGIVAGITEVIWANMVLKAGIDDPVEAVAVHLGAGIWGTLAAPLFSVDTGIFYQWDSDSFKQFGWNIVGCLTIIAWVGVTMSIAFFTGNFFGLVRVTEKVELEGIDLYKHGEPAYPRDAYQDSQVTTGSQDFSKLQREGESNKATENDQVYINGHRVPVKNARPTA